MSTGSCDATDDLRDESCSCPKESSTGEMSESGANKTPTTPGGDLILAGDRDTGRGRSRGGRGGNRGCGHGGRGNCSGATGRSSGPIFKGNTDGMKGTVFQCHGENADKQQYMKTVGILEEYINKTFTYTQDIASICKSFKIVSLVQPANLSKEEYAQDMGKKMIWETHMKSYLKRVDLMESNTRAIYAIVWGQCSPMMRSKLESLDDFGAKSDDCECIWLLKEIQGITHHFEGRHNGFISLDDAWSGYFSCRQGQQQTLHEYLKDFQSLVQVLEHYGAALGANGPYQDSVKAHVRREAPEGLTLEDYHKREVAAAKKKSLAISFLKGADRKRYGGLWSDLKNNFIRGHDHNPEDLTGAYNLLLNYKAPFPQQLGRHRKNATEETQVSGVSFLQNAAVTPGTDGVTHARGKVLQLPVPRTLCRQLPRNETGRCTDASD